MSRVNGGLDGLIGGIHHGKVRRKANNTRKLLTTAKRVTSKSAKGVPGQPEVMVKVTGFGKGGGHAKAHLTYITRNGKLELENDRGEMIQGAAAVKALAGEWTEDFGDTKSRKARRDTIHIMLSMAPGTEPEIVRSAVRAFAKETFGKNHEYAFVLHTDQAHPHCHLAVKYRGFDGKTVKSEKSDLQQWRETFAAELVKRGVEACATPRVSRGVVRKTEAQVLRHIVERTPERSARESKVRTLWIREAEAAVIADSKEGRKDTVPDPRPPTPWEIKLAETREVVVAAWLQAAAELEAVRPLAYKDQTSVKNERPNYDGISNERARAIHRAAFVYQSNIAKNGRLTAAEPIASVRNVSGRVVVWDRDNPQMLLQPDALHRVGKERAADSSVRRQGIGSRTAPVADRATSVAGHVEVKSGPQAVSFTGTVAESHELAKNIRAHVKHLPPLQTRHDLRKQMLIVGSQQQIQQPGQTLASASKQATEQAPSRAAPKGRAPER